VNHVRRKRPFWKVPGSRCKRREKTSSAAALILRKVSHTNKFESQPLLYCPMMVVFLAIRAMTKIRGTAHYAIDHSGIDQGFDWINPDEIEQQPEWLLAPSSLRFSWEEARVMDQ